jgi:hypothetical protein
MRPRRDDISDLMRSVGGLMLAVGAVVVVLRKSGDEAWTDFDRMLVLLVPTVVLYLLGVGVFGRPTRGAAEAGEDLARHSQSVLVVVSILLLPVTLLLFVSWAGIGTEHPLVDAGVFAATAVLAANAAWRSHVRFAALLASLSALIAWLFLFSKLLGHPSADAYRWLLVVAAACLALIARVLWRTKSSEAGELVTIAGLAAVLAGTVAAAARSISSRFLSAGDHHIPISGLQHFGWDLYLLVVSLTLVWLGSRIRVRGTGYVGAFGLLAFVGSVSAQVTRLQAGKTPTHDVVGWPLGLLILGTLGLFLTLLSRRNEA